MLTNHKYFTTKIHIYTSISLFLMSFVSNSNYNILFNLVF
jgi:hypothetical protein